MRQKTIVPINVYTTPANAANASFCEMCSAKNTDNSIWYGRKTESDESFQFDEVFSSHDGYDYSVKCCECNIL